MLIMIGGVNVFYQSINVGDSDYHVKGAPSLRLHNLMEYT